MFVRVKTRNNTDKKAVQIVKSFRDGKKVRQKVVQTVGYAYDDITLDKLKDVANHLKIRLEIEEQPTLFHNDYLIDSGIRAYEKKQQEKDKKLPLDLVDLRNKSTIISGIHDIYGKLYDYLDFQNLFTKRRKLSSNVLKQLVLARLANPCSKKATVSMLKNDFGIEIDLTKVYRVMDDVDDKLIEKLQKKSYQSTQKILGKTVKIAFYDCTTLYFESFSPDELKENGYSKDGKFNQPQILLSLTITEEGLPLGYDVFPGSTYEGGTLAKALESLKVKYKLEDIIIVADSGLLNKDNIEYIEKEGYSYILGARLKSLSISKQNEILKGMEDSELTQNEYISKSYEAEHLNRRLIVRYSSKRAIKDRIDREKSVEKLKKKLEKSTNPSSFLSNYGYKKYLKCIGEERGKIELNETKLESEKKWDGLSGVSTNVRNKSKEEIINLYKELWQIESCFRVQKHDLKIRPIYHWTPKRVKSHIAICYMAFCCQQYLRYRLKLQNELMSTEVIRDSLIRIQHMISYDIKTTKLYAIPSKLNDSASRIYKIMQVKYSPIPFEIETQNI